MEKILQFKEIIHQLIKLFSDLTELEQSKLQAITENNLKELEECMSKEQVAVMQLRVLEKHRDEIQSEMRMKGLSFQEIIRIFDGDEKNELERMYHQLADVLTVFNSTADSAKTAIESNLYSIEAILERLKQKDRKQAQVQGKSISERKA